MSYKPLDDSDTNSEIELNKSISEMIHKHPKDNLHVSDESTKDSAKLLSSGEYNDYEDVLKVLGFGIAHILLLLGTGVAFSSDAVEILSISFALPIIRGPSELDIANWQNGLLSSVIFFGMLIGGYSWGGIADISGRRFTLITSLSVNGLFGALSSFSPNFYVLLFLRFLSGVGVGGSLPVVLPYISEFMQTKYRGPYLGVLSSFWMIGALLCGGFAWALLPLDLSIKGFHSWRIYILVSSLPSLIGAILFLIVMPESPRYLLEAGKERKAIQTLKRFHSLNQLFKRREQRTCFTIERIRISHLNSEEADTNDAATSTVCIKEKGLKVFHSMKEILHRTKLLFYRNLLKSTSLLLIIYFCLAFGSYGVTLWYPTYVDRLSKESLGSGLYHDDCNHTFSNYTASTNLRDIEKLFCACPKTTFQNVTLEDIVLDKWWAYDSTISNFIVKESYFTELWFENVTLDMVLFENVTFYNSYFSTITWSNVMFVNVTFTNTSICNVSDWNTTFQFTTFENCTINDVVPVSNEELLALLKSSNSSCDNLAPPTNCIDLDEVDLRKEYFYDFVIAASAFPGNIVSAFAVYLFRRSFWLAFSFFLSAISVFLLYFVHTEVYAVLILCLFNTIMIPAFNTAPLIVTEVYPTSLRTTANGTLLLLARIGAIIGSYTFGAFSNTDQISVPILLTAAVLFVSCVASVFLPKTNKKTPLP